MNDFIDTLERDLVDAARRRTEARRARRPHPWSGLRGGFLTAALVVGVAGTAAAGTLTALRGSPIPTPRAVPAEQTALANTARVSAVRASDPRANEPPWTVRTARGATGLLCSTVGQVVEGEFGIVGLDGRFRPIPADASDSCGTPRTGAASLIGARVFDAPAPSDVRTVVSGVAGRELRSVVIRARGREISLPVAHGGVFALALRGYPEDSAITATLRFRSGRREIHRLGASPSIVLDPEGGPAWRVTQGMTSGDRRLCVAFTPARRTRNAPMSPPACGDLGTWTLGTPSRPQRNSWFFAARRLTPGSRGGGGRAFPPGNWRRHPPRTAVWGAVGPGVLSVTAQLPGQRPRSILQRRLRTILAVYPGDVDPATVVIRIRLRNGSSVVRRGSDRLVNRRLPAPKPVPPPPSRRSG